MIGIRLRGGLGNQMFQYAAARTLADSLDCMLLTSDHQVGAGLVAAAHRIGLRRRKPAGGVQLSGILRGALQCAPRFQHGRVREVAVPSQARMVFRRWFSPVMVGGAMSYERFDESLLRQGSGTWLRGYYQSEKYFAGNADRVREWFSLRPIHRDQVESAIAGWSAPPDRIVAIHVRRGDYTIMRNALAGGDGWALPSGYYRRALERVPRDAKLAIFTDDPDWAEKEFADRLPWVARGNSAVVDMFLMARCRWVVTANSSFSWWSAWLNSRPDKVVFAPRFHLGWRIGRWVPEGIEVAGWQYLSVID